MEYKKCLSCNETLALSNFWAAKNKKYGSYCKICDNLRRKINPKLYAGSLYKNIRRRLKNDKSYASIKCYFTRSVFIEYALSDEQYLNLHDNWKKHSYDRKLSPSVDRIDNKKDYFLGNIQFLTWLANSNKRGNPQSLICPHCHQEVIINYGV